ncbi:hypothetical protein [Phormidium sp. CCY1219]|uniref:hypothetical protein n=1 Tax=Phormidium sp. CCY1219 TaxID=2886104 RepID=UPI002D1E9848|nr:hypothetical protein [Phormidium sp. CCY1219]MEB3827911.1 hypothetical protein [Phormidium sp. CCY1219]
MAVKFGLGVGHQRFDFFRHLFVAKLGQLFGLFRTNFAEISVRVLFDLIGGKGVILIEHAEDFGGVFAGGGDFHFAAPSFHS